MAAETGPTIKLDHQAIQQIAETAADRTVRNIFLILGVDIAESEQLFRLQADFIHLRRWRMAIEKAESVGGKVVVTTIVSGLMGALWLGFSDKIKALLHIPL